MDGKVEEYRKAIAHGAPVMRTLPGPLQGQTAKMLYKIHSATNLPNGKEVLVKPYHEATNENAKFWMGHPIAGWAEMTNQSLWHAANMGAMHQEVHVSEHDMGPGLDKHPALVIHIEPDTDYVSGLHPLTFDRSMATDGVKIGVMDFLSNNLDRHRHNLLVRQPNAVDSTGIPYRSRLLAIDHTRNFQYHAAHKGAPSHVEDRFLENPTVPQSIRDANNAMAKTTDSLLTYLQSDALRHISESAKGFGEPPVHHPPHFLHVIEQWWPEVRNRVIAAFGDRLEGIREPRMKSHLLENFKMRVEKLDDMAARPDWYLDTARLEDAQVPLKVWDR
jgi:hypothetical protein